MFSKSSELEKIHQAVKKTQEKPDSENYISLEPNKTLKFVDVDSKIIKAVFHENDVEISKGNFISIKEIEQNQKIVNALLKRYLEMRHYDFQGDEIADELNNIVRNATGKDIKDL